MTNPTESEVIATLVAAWQNMSGDDVLTMWQRHHDIAGGLTWLAARARVRLELD